MTGHDDSNTPKGYSEPGASVRRHAGLPEQASKPQPGQPAQSFIPPNPASHFPDISSDETALIISFNFRSPPLPGWSNPWQIQYAPPFVEAVAAMVSDLRKAYEILLEASQNPAHPGHRLLNRLLIENQLSVGQILGGKGQADTIQPYLDSRAEGSKDSMALISAGSRGNAIQLGAVDRTSQMVASYSHPLDASAPILAFANAIESARELKQREQENRNPVNPQVNVDPTRGSIIPQAEQREGANAEPQRSTAATDQPDTGGRVGGSGEPGPNGPGV